MITINVKNIEGQTVIPVAGSALAAGYDIIATEDPKIVGEQLPASYNEPNWWKSVDYLEYHTGLYIAPQSVGKTMDGNSVHAFHTLLHPRSSVRKYNLVLANSIGLVDNDYRGEIIMCFKYIWQPEDFIWGQVQDTATTGSAPEMMMLGMININKVYKKGDKIGQLVAEQTNPITFRLVDNLEETARGAGGFGSTDAQPAVAASATAATPEKRYSVNEKTDVLSPLVEAYNKAGGVPVKRRYSDELKDKIKQGK